MAETEGRDFGLDALPPLTCSEVIWSLWTSGRSSSARVFRFGLHHGQAISAADRVRRPGAPRSGPVKIPAATAFGEVHAAKIGLLMEYAKASASTRPISAVPIVSVIMVLRASTTAASASVRKLKPGRRDHFHKSSVQPRLRRLLHEGEGCRKNSLLRRPEA